MLILAQAKLLDACITDYRHPEAMTWVDGLIVTIDYFYLASVLRSFSSPAFLGFITNSSLLTLRVDLLNPKHLYLTYIFFNIK